MAVAARLVTLPQDAVARICQHLAEHDIYQLACTCRGLSWLLDLECDALVWRQKCAQAFAGTVVQPSTWLRQRNDSHGSQSLLQRWPPLSYRFVLTVQAIPYEYVKSNDAGA